MKNEKNKIKKNKKNKPVQHTIQAIDSQPGETVLPDDCDIHSLYAKVRTILEQARQKTARAINSEMVRAYWLIGQAIVEHEQKGEIRAEYGKRIIELLSERITKEFGKGCDKSNLWHMRNFYLTFPNFIDSPRRELSWTHYRLLLKVEKSAARGFYEQEAAEQNWSTRELERQITTLFFERLLLSKQKRQMLVKNQAKVEKYTPEDCIKDPVILEFLGITATPQLNEAKLEEALIQHLQEFLLELGKGFSFVARQQRLTIDGEGAIQ